MNNSIYDFYKISKYTNVFLNNLKYKIDVYKSKKSFTIYDMGDFFDFQIKLVKKLTQRQILQFFISYGWQYQKLKQL